MVGRGGGKTMGNRNKEGKGCGGNYNMNTSGPRRPLNPLNHVQNEGTHSIHKKIKIVGSSGQVRKEGNLNLPNNFVGSSNELENDHNHDPASHNVVESFNRVQHTQNQDDDMDLIEDQFENESHGFISPEIRDIAGPLGKRKRTNNLVRRINMALEATEVMDPPIRRDEGENARSRRNERRDDQMLNHDSAHSTINGDATQNGEATSKVRQKGERGKYKSYVVDMKIKGNKSKLEIYIPDDIDRAIGDNARHLVNECGRVVRTRAPLNVKNWKEAFGAVGDVMWKEIEEKFEIKQGSSYIKMQAFAIDTMQRLYRLWRARLHSYYKSKECGQTDEERLKNPPPDLPQDQWQHCIQRFGSEEFKAISARNSKNRLSDKRTKHTTGNLSFAEFENMLEQQNKGVKPPADVIWLAEHTKKNDKGKLEWADQARSKEIHEQLKVAVATHGETMTQEEILLDVLKPRSGYFRGKGTALRGYSKGRQQLEQQNLIHEQQKKIQEQDQRIKELQENQEKTARQIDQQREDMQRDMQRAMDALKQEMLQQLTSRGA